MNKNGTWIADAEYIKGYEKYYQSSVAFFLLLEHEGTKFVTECKLLMSAYDHFYSYPDARDMGARIMDLTCAVNRFLRLYEKELPKFCENLKMNYHFMDTQSIKLLIAENEMEVRGVLKREEKESKKMDIIAAKSDYFV